MYSLAIQHPASNLPEIFINDGFSLSVILKAMVSEIINTSHSAKYSCCSTKIEGDLQDANFSSQAYVSVDKEKGLFEVVETSFCAKEG